MIVQPKRPYRSTRLVRPTGQSAVAIGSTVVVACLASILVNPVAALGADRQPDRPNVILCMADDQGWGDVGYMNHPVLKTPVLDEMASSGLRFDRFYAAAPVCSPTRGSVLTGRHPNRFGCFSWGYTLRPQEVTLAEALRSAGYVTGHFGKWHLGAVTSTSPVSPGASGFDEWYSAPNFFDLDPLLSHRGTVESFRGDSSDVTVETAIPFIRQAVRDEKPFLAVVWFGSPHSPHRALPEDRKPYLDQPKKKQDFYGELAAMDRAIGRLRQELTSLGVRNNTIFWYCSDNGALGVGSTGGLSGRKGNLYEGGIRVPAIIEWPARIRSARRTSMPCSTVDIYPTILQLTGTTVENQPVLDGISLAPLVNGTSMKRSKPLGFWVYPRRGIGTPAQQILARLLAEQQGKKGKGPTQADGPAVPLGQTFPVDDLPGSAAWIDGDYKLLRLAPSRGRPQSERLYHLGRDPKERHDLSSQEPERLRQMRKALEAWQRSVVESLNTGR